MKDAWGGAFWSHCDAPKERKSRRKGRANQAPCLGSFGAVYLENSANWQFALPFRRRTGFMNFRLKLALAPALLVLALNVFAQEREARPQEDPAHQRIRALAERLNFLEQTLTKDIDDIKAVRRIGYITVAATV